MHKRARVRVRDSGDGFDWSKHAEADAAASHRRGIMLVRQLCSGLEYRGRGNEAVALYDMRRGGRMKQLFQAENQHHGTVAS